MEVPISRVYQCYLEGPEAPKSGACKAVVKVGGTQPLYDWTEVNQFEANGHHKQIVKNGTLCAGGRDKYVGLDLLRKDWPVSNLRPDANGKFTFKFHAMTPHATKYFNFYITKDGWTPTSQLDWRDLKKFASVAAPTADGNYYNMTVKMPKGMTGRRLIYVVWQRSDSQEAFYSCSDVNVRAPKKASAAESTAAWEDVGRAIAHNDLKSGSTVAFRVFGADGADIERHVIEVTAKTGAATAWPAALAKKVNATSSIFRIGVVGANGEVEPVEAASGNSVFLSDGYPGYSFQIDIDTPGGNQGHAAHAGHGAASTASSPTSQ